MSSYGYMGTYKPPRVVARGVASGLAHAAAAKDPYGLAPNNRGGPLGIGSNAGFAAPSRTAAHPYSPSVGGASPGARDGNGESYPNQPPATVAPSAPTASSVNAYDVNTDPALQQIQSLVGLNNEQAQASALKQRQNLLLGYGDKSLAESILGASDPIALAAGQNPTGTVQQLGQQRDRNLKTLTDGLNADNLAYSGYRVNQEQQAGQDYQNALAQAAGQLNQNLGSVDDNLTSAISSNNNQLAQAISSAADRAAAAAAASGTDPGADPGATDPNALPNAAAGGSQASGSSAGYGSGAAPVGTTLNDLIYQLLGRKNDPAYQWA